MRCDIMKDSQTHSIDQLMRMCASRVISYHSSLEVFTTDVTQCGPRMHDAVFVICCPAVGAFIQSRDARTENSV